MQASSKEGKYEHFLGSQKVKREGGKQKG